MRSTVTICFTFVILILSSLPSSSAEEIFVEFEGVKTNCSSIFKKLKEGTLKQNETNLAFRCIKAEKKARGEGGFEFSVGKS